MENEIKLTPNDILNQKFTKDVKGYNPTEVDEFLDCVIKDYMTFLSYVEKSTQYQETLKEKIKALETTIREKDDASSKQVEQMRRLEAENAKWSEKVGHIKPSDHVTEENMDYINKINIYEEFLLSKGVKPADVIRAAQKYK